MPVYRAVHPFINCRLLTFYTLPIQPFSYRISAIPAGEILYAKVQRPDGRQVPLH